MKQFKQFLNQSKKTVSGTNQTGYKYRSTEDFFKDVRKEVFARLDNSLLHEFIPDNDTNEIASEMMANPTEDFKKAGDVVLCRYIDLWKGAKLTEGGE